METLNTFLWLLIVSVFSAVVSFIYVIYKDTALGRYLKKNNYKRWRQLTSIGKYGPGMVNPSRGWSYIYSKADNKNEEILRFKDEIKIGVRWLLATIIAIVFVVMVIFYLGIAGGSNL